MSYTSEFADQVTKCDMRTQVLLRNAGWTSSRQIDISNYVYQLNQAGYTVFPKLQKFLGSFGELYIEWTIFDEATGKNLHTDIRIDPIGALARIGDEGLDDLEEFLEESLCPLGLLDHASEILIMDIQGQVYSYFELLIYRCGDTGVQAIDTLITNKPILILRDAEGNAVHEWR